MITFDIDKNSIYFKTLLKKIKKIHLFLHNDDENKNLGWVTHPVSTNSVLDKLVVARIKKFKYDTLVLVGVGGSINASRAIISALPTKINVIYIGENFENINSILDTLKTKKPLFHIMSSSGDTLEPLIALHQIEKFLTSNQMKINEHMLISTSNMQGYLYKYGVKHKINIITYPNNYPGRFSAIFNHLSNIILAKLNVNSFIQGAKDAYFELYKDLDNPCYHFAVNRIFNQTRKKKKIELISVFADQLKGIAEWYCQLISESEGKDNKGAFPVVMKMSKDLHSYEQFLQQGADICYEQFILAKNVDSSKYICPDKDCPSAQFSSMTFDEINSTCFSSVKAAHDKNKIPNNTILLDKLDEYNFGYLFYFFEKACAMSCMLKNIDPFSQPGVDDYKNNMKIKLSQNKK